VNFRNGSMPIGSAALTQFTSVTDKQTAGEQPALQYCHAKIPLLTEAFTRRLATSEQIGQNPSNSTPVTRESLVQFCMYIFVKRKTLENLGYNYALF
jgi:hypothetical protein